MTCDTCGAEVTVVGTVTKHYEPVYTKGQFEKLEARLMEETKIFRERLGPAGWKLLSELVAARNVVLAARGLKAHGEALNGTHAELLWEALGIYDRVKK